MISHGLVAVVLGLVVWIGFPVIILSGSMMWDNIPWEVAVVHAGDWFLKLIIIAVIVGLWR